MNGLLEVLSSDWMLLDVLSSDWMLLDVPSSDEWIVGCRFDMKSDRLRTQNGLPYRKRVSDAAIPDDSRQNLIGK